MAVVVHVGAPRMVVVVSEHCPRMHFFQTQKL